jgi:AcrR family transcriptional regulator
MVTTAREPDGSPGRRERKKQRTAEAIRHAATELFLAHGYDGTTTEQIAEAADVSVSTFFRYFPTKESVLLRTADGADVVRRGLEMRAEGEPLWAALSRALLEGLPALIDRPDEELARIRIAYGTPSVRGAIAAAMGRMQEEIAIAIRPSFRRGKDGDLEARVMAGALCAAIEVTQDLFVARQARGDAFALLARALELYGAGFDHVEA